MIWFWVWHENKFIKKMKQGIVFYTKPNKIDKPNKINKVEPNRRLETKRIRTHTKK